MKERLTKKGGLNFADKALSLVNEWGYSHIYNRLAELEDKMEQGTLIELPCKLDSEIYIVDYLTDDEDKKHYYIRKSTFHPPWIDEWRNMFCLTREEAEKKLEELNNG